MGESGGAKGAVSFSIKPKEPEPAPLDGCVALPVDPESDEETTAENIGQ